MLFAEFQMHALGDIALLVHVVGAVVLVGGLVTAATAGIIGWSDERGDLRRLSYRTLLLVAFPGYIVMRVGAQWIYSREGWGTGGVSDPTWIGIGFITSDLGGLLLLISLIVGGIGMRRMRNGGGSGLIKSASVVATLLVAVYVVTVWAMGAKPG